MSDRAASTQMAFSNFDAGMILLHFLNISDFRGFASLALSLNSDLKHCERWHTPYIFLWPMFGGPKYLF